MILRRANLGKTSGIALLTALLVLLLLSSVLVEIAIDFGDFGTAIVRNEQ